MPPQPEPGNRVHCILTTFDKEEAASDVIRVLVREKLIACGTLFRGARSIYVWQDTLQDSEEVVALLKTTSESVPAAAERLRALHTYEMPEILTFPADSASDDYARWIAKLVSPAEKEN